MNAITEPNTTAVANVGGDPFSTYGEIASRGGATYLRFSKGEWLLGKDENTDHEGRQLAARMDGLMIGWVHWEDRRPVERVMGLLVDGFKPPLRSELGDLDQDLWPKDSEGRPQDPWQLTNELPMADLDTGEQILFTANSTGAIGAIGNLCKAYGKEYRLREGQVPVIELNTDSYKHTVYGKVWVPVLPIKGWVDNDGIAPAPAAEAEEKAPEPEPEVKQEPKPKAKAAQGRTRF